MFKVVLPVGAKRRLITKLKKKNWGRGYRKGLWKALTYFWESRSHAQERPELLSFMTELEALYK